MSSDIRTPNAPARILQLFKQLKFRVAEITDDIKQAILKAWRRWQSLHWTIRWATYGAMLGLLAFALMPVVGFTTGGVTAGSHAAIWQSTIGNVSAGSLFAWLQSTGATASVGTAVAFSATGAAASVASGAVVGGIQKLWGRWRRGPDDSPPKEE